MTRPLGGVGLCLLSGCAPGLRGLPEPVPVLQGQSCVLSPGCMAPAASGEWLVPSASAGVRAAQAVRGLLTLKDFLDEAEIAQVEAVLVRCAREADFQVNEREYGQGKTPDDAECNRVVGRDRRDNEITRAMELGTMKHEVAFACVERELSQKFPDHLTREPQYGKNPTTGGYSLTDEPSGSLAPDIVLHFFQNAVRIQRLYDFYFPCTRSKKSDPLGDDRKTLEIKLKKYKFLSGAKKPAMVTPQLGISR